MKNNQNINNLVAIQGEDAQLRGCFVARNYKVFIFFSRTFGCLPFLVFILSLNTCTPGVPKKRGSSLTTDTSKHNKQNFHANPKSGGIKKDTLAFTVQGVYGEISNCKNSNGCDHISISYPEFIKDKALNEAIKNKLKHLLNNYPDSTNSFEDNLKNIVKSYTDQTDSSDPQQQPETEDDYVNIEAEDSSLILLEFSQETSGGVHPNNYIEYLTWDKKADKEISPNDVFKNNYYPMLTEIGERIFRKNENLNKTEPLDAFNMDGDDPKGVFYLNDNFYFTSEGIHYYYNSYEIKPYMGGPTDLLIPYSEIKKIIRPHSVITQYIK